MISVDHEIIDDHIITVKTPCGDYLEYKPNTPRGRARGRAAKKLYERQLGRKVRVFCYNVVNAKVILEKLAISETGWGAIAKRILNEIPGI
jgi:hypothetical protein